MVWNSFLQIKINNSYFYQYYDLPWDFGGIVTIREKNIAGWTKKETVLFRNKPNQFHIIHLWIVCGGEICSLMAMVIVDGHSVAGLSILEPSSFSLDLKIIFTRRFTNIITQILYTCTQNTLRDIWFTMLCNDNDGFDQSRLRFCGTNRGKISVRMSLPLCSCWVFSIVNGL